MERGGGEGCSSEEGSWQIRFTRQRLESLRQWAAAPLEHGGREEREFEFEVWEQVEMCLFAHKFNIARKRVAAYPVR